MRGERMRLVIEKYYDGGTYVAETSDDGGRLIKDLSGPRQPDDSVAIFMEVACDNNAQGMDKLLSALEWVTDEAKRRKKEYAEKKRQRAAS